MAHNLKIVTAVFVFTVIVYLASQLAIETSRLCSLMAASSVKCVKTLKTYKRVETFGQFKQHLSN